jgi:alpha-amylase
MQYESLKKIFELKPKVLSTNNQKLIEQWRRLQTSDHFYYMCTKYWADGDVHKYFSPFKSPYDAYIYYMNVISDLEIVLKKI